MTHHKDLLENPETAKARAHMVSQQLSDRGISDPRVLDAMRAVPRHLFVPPELRHMAYLDGPLHIGHEQTISQPYIVGVMTQLLRPGPEDRVLEIGVGSGYQTAVLAEMAREVIGLERIAELTEEAAARLRDLGYDNVNIHTADGTEGYPDEAPYDRILVAAAAPSLPEPLLEQLAIGGRMVIPVGGPDDQVIELVWRRGETYHIERLIAVRFVPLLGKFGFKKGW